MRQATEQRSVILFQELIPDADLKQQKEIGKMSHWQAKQYVNDLPEDDDGIYFTVTYKEYSQEINASPDKKRRKRRTKKEMQAARGTRGKGAK